MTMKTFKAITYDAGLLTLASSDDIQTLYDCLESGEDFLIGWLNDEGVDCSELIIASNLVSKVRNGDTIVCSEETLSEEVEE